MNISRGFALALAATATVAFTTAFAGAPICGDVNGSGTLTTSDAMLVLKKSVGQPVNLLCAAVAGLPKTGDGTSYGAGSDGAVQSGTARSFTDNGDGTVTDNVTGLMWEKKDRSGTVHDVDAFPTWSETGSALDGNIVSWFLDTLNAGSGFAGHTDWRLPNQFELYTLIDFGKSAPAVDAAFQSNCANGCTVLSCSCTRSDWYWSSTTDHALATRAYAVQFSDGSAAPIYKSQSLVARAVRNAN